MDAKAALHAAVHILSGSWHSAYFEQGNKGNHLYIESRPYHLAVLYELWDYGAHNIDRDCKAHPSRCAGVGEDSSVHPYHTPLHNTPYIRNTCDYCCVEEALFDSRQVSDNVIPCLCLATGKKRKEKMVQVKRWLVQPSVFAPSPIQSNMTPRPVKGWKDLFSS